MQVEHHIIFQGNSEVAKDLDSLGIAYKKTTEPGGRWTGAFDSSDTDPHWSQVAALIQAHQMFDTASTSFSEAEIRQAQWLRLSIGFEQGYPQPVRTWKKVVFYNSGCRTCGAGKRQKASFQLREPHMGKHSFVTPYWDPIIVAKLAVFDALQAVGFTGYEKYPIELHPSRRPLKTVAQVYISHETSPGLQRKEQLTAETCLECGKIKYTPVKTTMLAYDKAVLPSDLDFVRTAEWFGSGGVAFQAVLVTNRVAQFILDAGWQGANLFPIE